MTLLPFALVLVSIVTHAYWNFLVKSSGNKHIFTSLSKVAEVILFAVPASYFLVGTSFQAQYLLLIIVGACLSFVNYCFLSSAYKYGDLSLVYPVSRSSVIFLPILAFVFIDERINTVGVSAIVLILVGTFVMHMDSLDRNGCRTIFKNINNKGSVYAIFSALAVAGYTLWDKIAISQMEPFLYFYSYTVIVAVLYNLLTLSKYKKEEIVREWKQNRSKIVQVGFLNSFTYMLILTALTMSKATYVGGLRQLSIVAGAFFGYKLLSEKFGTPKLIGISISIAGGCLIYLAG